MSSLKILSFNIHKGISSNARRHILPNIKALLEKLDPDIVFLQEVQGAHHKRKAKFIDWPSEHPLEYLAKGQFDYFLYGENASYKNGHHGNGLLSKYPLTFIGNQDLSTHKYSQRGALYATVEWQQTPIHLLCTHLGLFNKERELQLKKLSSFISEKVPADAALIVAGDFNDWQRKAKPFCSNLSLTEAFESTTGRYAKTYPARFPLLAVDRVYFRGFECAEATVIPTKYLSDHLPLSVNLSQ
jgi:endonuclease/exonuclease/phosphatase family metal-dependent hydrolase